MEDSGKRKSDEEQTGSKETGKDDLRGMSPGRL